MDALVDKATGALAGAAVGDALGGAAEGNTPEAIQERYDGFIDRHRPAVPRRLAQRPARSRRTTRATATSPTTPS